MAILLMVAVFPALRRTYKPKAATSLTSILKILPRVTFTNQNWTESEIRTLTQRYSGVIFSNQNLEQLNELIPLFKHANPDFKIYYEVPIAQTTTLALDYPILIKHPEWFLSDLTLDIRDPLYRQHFFSYWTQELNKVDVDGIYLSGLNRCPIIAGSPSCRPQYDWWTISLLDFMAQIRQSFSGQTLFFEGAPIVSKSEDFTQQLLLQTDGMVLSDFAAIANDPATFKRYYQFLVNLAQNPSFSGKKLIFQVTNEASKEPFYLASYLLFANEHSFYYFSSGIDSDLNWIESWDRLMMKSTNLPQIKIDGLYERILGNALILVNPISLQAQITALPGETTEPTTLPGQPELADWSDNNSSVFADFDNVYIETRSDSVILGDQVTVESGPKSLDDGDDGLYLDGLEAGIFNLNRLQVYDGRIKLTRPGQNGYQLSVWLDWDGKGGLTPELIFEIKNNQTATQNFKLIVPSTAKDFIYLRVMVDDQGHGEVEDYRLTIQ